MVCCPRWLAVVYWLSSWLAEQEVRGLIPDIAAIISEIGDLLLPNRDLAEMFPGRFTLFTSSPWVVSSLVGSPFGR